MVRLTQTFICVATIVIVAYDIVAISVAGNQATISVQIYQASKEYPAIPFFFGCLMGHFFLRLHIPEEAKK